MVAFLIRSFLYATLACVCLQEAAALNPQKSFEQYSRTVWNQQDGLPQDTVTAIAQTPDGYLWLGTNEGLTRFDGYEFTAFNNINGELLSNSITALTVGSDGSLWIGTANGLARLVNRRFYVYTAANGLPDNTIDQLCVDHSGNLWIVAGGALVRFDGKHFTVFLPGKGLSITAKTVYEDDRNVLWVGGLGGVGRFSEGVFTPVIDSRTLSGNISQQLFGDRQGNLWIAGSLGIVRRSPDGKILKFNRRNGLPDDFVRALWLDREGNLWAGTNSGLARLRGDRFNKEGQGDLIRCLFEDREGNLWVAAASGLNRLRDDVFTVYGRTEGLPSDSPNTVFEDRNGNMWVGFHDSGLMLFSLKGYRTLVTHEGFPNEEVFSIRQSRSGHLLLSTRGGLIRMHGAHFKTYLAPDEFGRRHVFDSLEDSSGRVWAALPSGLWQLRGEKLHMVIAGGPSGNSSVVALQEGQDGVLWAGTYTQGLWRIRGEEKRRFTTNDGLSSNHIRFLYQDREGTLWIGTSDGGLNAFRDGSFTHFTAKDGLLSNNIASIVEDEESLWLSTTRGICRVSKQELRDFSEHKIRSLRPTNYGVEDGLRSAQAAPMYPVSGGGTRTSDGRLWFPTSRGLAVIDPNAPQEQERAPIVHLVEATVDGNLVDLSQAPQLPSSTQRIQIRYAAIHLSAPERVQYSHKLEGLDTDWVQAGRRRGISYNSLPHGRYRFLLRAELPGEPAAVEAYDFEKLPTLYETVWFRLLLVTALLAGAWGAYQLRVRRLRYGFALVLEERARLAREIHDTLAQGFVGISSQLEAVATALSHDLDSARTCLDIARKMARHSMTEARRSIMDLRDSVFEGHNLATALRSRAHMCTAGSGVLVEVDVSGAEGKLPNNFEQQVLRIVQEAVTNAVKHARATKIWVKLHMRPDKQLYLQIADDGQGFDQQNAFCPVRGHFGLIGMRERAEGLGGELRLATRPGEGTRIEVTVPLQ